MRKKAKEVQASLYDFVQRKNADMSAISKMIDDYAYLFDCAEDLKKNGANVILLQDCLAYVSEEGHEKALAEMKNEGIRIC